MAGFEFDGSIEQILNAQAKCPHPMMMGVWPRTGKPRLYCPECGFARTMTATEQVTREAEMKRKT